MIFKRIVYIQSEGELTMVAQLMHDFFLLYSAQLEEKPKHIREENVCFHDSCIVGNTNDNAAISWHADRRVCSVERRLVSYQEWLLLGASLISWRGARTSALASSISAEYLMHACITELSCSSLKSCRKTNACYELPLAHLQQAAS
jgi:hypothetical protein